MLAVRNQWLNGADIEVLDPVVGEFLPLGGYLIRRMHASRVPDETVSSESLAAILWAIQDSWNYPTFTIGTYVRYALLTAGFSLLKEAYPEWTQGTARTAERDFMAMSLVAGSDPAEEPAPPTLVSGWRETALARLADLAAAGGLARGLRPGGPSVSSRLERLAAAESP